MDYYWLKWLHLVGVVIYAGGFLSLTRLIGHAVRFESPIARADAFRVFRRMHKFVDWPGLAIMLVTGVWLLLKQPSVYFKNPTGYFHIKLTLIVVLLVCEVLLSRKLFSLRAEGEQPRATFFRVLHGVSALAIVGILYAVMIVRAG
jgi:protoporphyrinogen IX oxidase